MLKKTLNKHGVEIMEYLTSGCINKDYVSKYVKCILECAEIDGFGELVLDIRKSATLADRRYGLNCANTTCESDSWYEALAQVEKNGGWP